MSHQRVSDRRTQIYLPEELYQLVKAEANKKNASIAQIIRRSIRQALKPTKKSIDKKQKTKLSNPFLKFAGILSDKSAPDLSSNTPKYLREMYQQKRP